jgi:hypothetical protein
MSKNGIHQLEERVTRLEEELGQLKLQLAKKEEKPWWERSAGMFKGDKMFEEIVQEMRKNRRADYAAAAAEAAQKARDKRRKKQRLKNEG